MMAFFLAGVFVILFQTIWHGFSFVYDMIPYINLMQSKFTHHFYIYTFIEYIPRHFVSYISGFLYAIVIVKMQKNITLASYVFYAFYIICISFSIFWNLSINSHFTDISLKLYFYTASLDLITALLGIYSCTIYLRKDSKKKYLLNM